MNNNSTWRFHNSNTISQTNTSQVVFEPDGNSAQRLYHVVAICIVHLFLCFTSLFGNFVTLIAIWKTSSLRSPANTLLSSLASTDFAIALIVQPFYIEYAISASSRIHRVVHNMLTSFLCSASFFTTTAIGVDRLLALQLHLRYESLVTQFRVRWAILFIWIVSALLATLPAWMSSYVYFKILVSVIMTLLVENFVVYLRIYLIVRRHQLQIQQQQHETNNSNIFSVKRLTKSAVSTFLVFILLLCCYAPFAVARIFVINGENISATISDSTSIILFLNSSLNPLLYCWRVREIRKAVKHIFCC